MSVTYHKIGVLLLDVQRDDSKQAV